MLQDFFQQSLHFVQNIKSDMITGMTKTTKLQSVQGYHYANKICAHDLPAYNIVPQPIMPQHALVTSDENLK
jgi:hypothetical protein